jgi:hypothetical protein
MIINVYRSAACNVPVPIFLSDFKESWTSSTVFRKKKSNNKFHWNPSSGSRAVPCGRTDGPTDMSKLTVAFRNFANAPDNRSWEMAVNCVKAREALRVICQQLFTLSPVCLIRTYKQRSNSRVLNFFPSYGAPAQRETWPPHYWGFSITKRRTTVGRTPLDEWSAPLPDNTPLTTNIHPHPPPPPLKFEPAIPVNERLQTHALYRSATGIGRI